MEAMHIYIFIVAALGVLAVSDLAVGVANDAVNFLNSAIGSKVAPMKVIMIVASLGVLIGATFSSGMMEVARKGLFNPSAFSFNEIMILFVAVMVTDIVLLDIFNTLGLPTSTTVSIVFDLLGAAVGVAIIKVAGTPGVSSIAGFINSSSALTIISGILISIVVAFTVGSVVMYITRVIFSFNYERNFRYLGSIYGGLAITAITYFIVVKGARGSALLSEDAVEWILSNSLKLMIISMAVWTIVLQILSSVFRINILKIIVLVGTFSLAMAFAGNDLVNFIGVPLAGWEAFRQWTVSGLAPDSLTMEGMAGAVKTPGIMLLISGLIMVMALWLSKKARSVTQTELNLSRQSEGSERFESNLFSRVIVRQGVDLNRFFKFILPDRFIHWLDSRFDQAEALNRQKESGAQFDFLRASVNMVVASTLIAIGTSYKLPLSTTYVTFMVAMSTALADRSWGRESAVNRISGVVTVIAGWFFTALAAFTISMLVAMFLMKSGFTGIVVSLLLTSAVVFLSFRAHKRRTAKSETQAASEAPRRKAGDYIPECQNFIISNMLQVSGFYDKSILGLIKEDRKKLRKLRRDIAGMNVEIKSRKDTAHIFIRKVSEENIEAGAYYVQIFDYLRESGHSMTYLNGPVYNHVMNNHPPLSLTQHKELRGLSLEFNEYVNFLIYILKSGNFEEIRPSLEKQALLLGTIETIRKRQLSRIKKGESGTKAGMLYLGFLSESKNLVLQMGNMIKAYRDFVNSMKKQQ
ncbi:MAG: inorganic phosphate transporter [Bacteroidales bacterium]|jgi:phosphate/sulfate permease|nr:inorganic phosphate transporter [Bacteroidales bacterium]